MADKIWVYIDHFRGKPHQASWEVIGAARELAEQAGGHVTAVVLGSGVRAVAEEAAKLGVGEVLLADHTGLEDYRAEVYATTLSSLSRQHSPDVLLFPTTSRGRELAAMLGVDLNAGVVPDVTAFEVQGDRVVATRPVYAGKLLSKALAKSTPQILTIRTRAFKSAEAAGSAADISSVEAAGVESAPTKVLEYSTSEGGVSLSDANVIVSGGRGIANNPKLTPSGGMDEKQAEIWRAQQGFKMLQELADVLGAAVGASRAAVDAGYIPYEHQVGQTGKVVSPDLYIAAGISGAIQHQAGMRTSKVIVAINKDPEAPIYKMARFGVVGDLHELIPAITEAFRKRLGK